MIRILISGCAIQIIIFDCEIRPLAAYTPPTYIKKCFIGLRSRAPLSVVAPFYCIDQETLPKKTLVNSKSENTNSKDVFFTQKTVFNVCFKDFWCKKKSDSDLVRRIQLVRIQG